jgi:hypothetical protein
VLQHAMEGRCRIGRQVGSWIGQIAVGCCVMCSKMHRVNGGWDREGGGREHSAATGSPASAPILAALVHCDLACAHGRLALALHCTRSAACRPWHAAAGEPAAGGQLPRLSVRCTPFSPARTWHTLCPAHDVLVHLHNACWISRYLCSWTRSTTLLALHTRANVVPLVVQVSDHFAVCLCGG